MGCIYLLYDDTGNGYIGKTTNLKKRLNYHKHKLNLCRSRFLNNFQYLVIEEFDDEDALDSAEQFYYDLYKDLYGDKIINKCRPLQQHKEYCEKNKERIAQYQKEYNEEYNERHKERLAEQKKEYRETHKERLLEKQKEWRQKNKERILEQMKQKITCDCGSVINYGDKSKHFKTQKHQNYLSNK